jgi:SAM-dependent methyltransferase
MNPVPTIPDLHVPSSIFDPQSSILLACPACRSPLSNRHESSLSCPACHFVLRLVNDIWRALPPKRMEYYQRFIQDYETIRQAEGRGSSDAHYYLSLPYHNYPGNLGWQWKIRGATYRCLERHVWPKVENLHPQGFDLLDVGAGNGWLSYRVAMRGQRPVAVDLIVNELDGLGAARHYWPVLKQTFPRFQAEMDRLPFANAQFDVVVFNAALHYSTNYEVSLKEALRCLRPSGYLLVMDSPIYQTEESGRRMVQEKHLQFEKQYGFRSDSVPSIEYLTLDRVRGLGSELGLCWEALHPWYGLAWTLRPLRSWLKGGREPSKFRVLLGQRTVE